MRINARLDEATEQQLEYLTQVTGQSVSHLVRESVAQYYVQVKAQRQPSHFVALAAAGRWHSGPGGTTTAARPVVMDALRAKYPQHFTDEPAAEPQVAPASKPAVARRKPRGA